MDRARFDLSELSETEISARLQRAYQKADPRPDFSESPYPSELLPDSPRPAAVLIPLLRVAGEWQILFTRRNSTLAEHSGQVAFPGGRSEPGDLSPEATALREAHEEIGLAPEDVRVLGRLNDFITITNYAVTPVVSAIPWPYKLTIQREEVSRVFTISLAWLSDPLHHEVRRRPIPSLGSHVDVIYFQPYDGELLWGASARFTLTLLNILGVFDAAR
jgi:8-oxo-dGTP pyrophosphatase MutT (NUDIX family)